MFHKKTKKQVPNLRRNDDKEFQLLALTAKNALGGMQLANTITEKGIKNKINEKVLSLLFFALGDNLLRREQECDFGKDLWQRLNHGHVVRSVVNKLGVLHSLPNMRLKYSDDMRHNIDNLKAQYFDLTAIGREVDKAIKQGM